MKPILDSDFLANILLWGADALPLAVGEDAAADLNPCADPIVDDGSIVGICS